MQILDLFGEYTLLRILCHIVHHYGSEHMKLHSIVLMSISFKFIKLCAIIYGAAYTSYHISEDSVVCNDHAYCNYADSGS